MVVREENAGRLSLLLPRLPALTSIRRLNLHVDLHSDPVGTQTFLAAAALALGRCPCLRCLHLRIDLAPDKPADQLPEALGQALAGAATLEELALSMYYHHGANRLGWPGVPHLVTGLAGLSRLRALTLYLYVGGEAALPACLSRLARLTSFD